MGEVQKVAPELLKRSMNTQSVSSDEFVMSKFTQIQEVKPEDYTLPDSYGIDTIKCMSVNPNTVYVYWEITPSTIEKYNLQSNSFLLTLMAVDTKPVEIMSFYVNEMVASRFLNIHIPNTRVVASLKVEIDGKMIEIMSSNSFETPSDDIGFGFNNRGFSSFSIASKE